MRSLVTLHEKTDLYAFLLNGHQGHQSNQIIAHLHAS